MTAVRRIVAQTPVVPPKHVLPLYPWVSVLNKPECIFCPFAQPFADAFYPFVTSLTHVEIRWVDTLTHPHLVAVVLVLVRALGRQAQVVGLHVGERGQLGVDVSQMQAGDLLVENLG